MSKAPQVTRARTQLIVNHAFFASIALKRPFIEDPNIKTACVNAAGQIRYNPTFVAGLTVPQTVFLIAHECMHWMMDNFTRMGRRNPKKWNRATDCVNNEILIKSRVGEFIPGGMRWPGAEDMTAEEVYTLLPDEPGDDNKDGKAGDSFGEDMDSSGAAKMDEAQRREIQAQIKQDVAQAAQVARQMGQMPAHLERFVEQLLQPKTPWYTILERFMDQQARCDYSWSKPNRRYMPLGLYLPTIQGNKLGAVAVVRDTSMSVTQAEQACFAGHVSTVLETCRPDVVYVLDVDAAVADVKELSVDDLPFDPGYRGGGGTDMRVGIRHVEEHLPDVSCIIVLTDGGTPWPDHSDIPIIVATTGTPAPSSLCESVHLEVD